MASLITLIVAIANIAIWVAITGNIVYGIIPAMITSLPLALLIAWVTVELED